MKKKTLMVLASALMLALPVSAQDGKAANNEKLKLVYLITDLLHLWSYRVKCFSLKQNPLTKKNTGM